MKTPNNLKLSFLEELEAKSFGTFDYLGYKFIGSPLPDQKDEEDGVVIDRKYFINESTNTILARKERRRNQRAARELENEQIEHSRYYREY